MKRKGIGIGIGILLIGIIIFISIQMKPEKKIKKYLQNNNYICSTTLCTTNKQNERIDFKLKEKTMKVLSYSYEFLIEDEYYQYTDYQTSTQCKYTWEEYKKGTLLTEENVKEDICKNYIEKVNPFIEEYNSILEKSHVSVNE